MALPCEGGTQHSAPRRAVTAPSVPCCPILQDGRGQGKKEADTLGGDKGSGRPRLGSTLTCCVTQASPLPSLSFVFFSWKIDWVCLQAYVRINLNEHKGFLHPLETCTQACTHVHTHTHTCTHSWWHRVTGIPVAVPRAPRTRMPFLGVSLGPGIRVRSLASPPPPAQTPSAPNL